MLKEAAMPQTLNSFFTASQSVPSTSSAPPAPPVSVKFQPTSEFELLTFVVRHKASGKDINFSKDVKIERLVGDTENRVFVALSNDLVSSVLQELIAAANSPSAPGSFPPVAKQVDESRVLENSDGMLCPTCKKSFDCGGPVSKVGKWSKHRVKLKTPYARKQVCFSMRHL